MEVTSCSTRSKLRGLRSSFGFPSPRSAMADTSRIHPSVLVVDDDADLRELMTLRLEHVGHKVTCEATCAAALAQLERTRFDAMVLDLRLPDGDGLAFLPRVKERVPDLPVIILTAHGS